MVVFHTMRSGVIVREDAMRLALDLDARGHSLTARDGKLVVGNGSLLTAADLAQIKSLRWHLLAIAGLKEQVG